MIEIGGGDGESLDVGVVWLSLVATAESPMWQCLCLVIRSSYPYVHSLYHIPDPHRTVSVSECVKEGGIIHPRLWTCQFWLATYTI